MDFCFSFLPRSFLHPSPHLPLCLSAQFNLLSHHRSLCFYLRPFTLSSPSLQLNYFLPDSLFTLSSCRLLPTHQLLFFSPSHAAHLSSSLHLACVRQCYFPVIVSWEGMSLRLNTCSPLVSWEFLQIVPLPPRFKLIQAHTLQRSIEICSGFEQTGEVDPQKIIKRRWGSSFLQLQPQRSQNSLTRSHYTFLREDNHSLLISDKGNRSSSMPSEYRTGMQTPLSQMETGLYWSCSTEWLLLCNRQWDPDIWIHVN